MVDSFTFQTRARTIDHLGREQIADVPTAISELWKNAYDAYARTVALHLYEGQPPTALIADDGHGMSKDQFIQNWLVVGTEAKATGEPVKSELRQGLPLRPKQGQKGIGRLSVAALGSTVLVVSKRPSSEFVACLIDWRLFENPYIYLQDIKLPVVEFAVAESLKGLLPSLRAAIIENLSGSSGPSDRAVRLKAAWNDFSNLELQQDAARPTTSSLVKESASRDLGFERELRDWSTWSSARPAGTALLMTDLSGALLAWVSGSSLASELADVSKASLKRTLTAFSDPYEQISSDALDYSVLVHRKGGVERVVGSDDDLGLNFLHSLDHTLEGEFNESGVFVGRIKAFGKDLGQVELVPSQPPPTSGKENIGPFSISLGAFEPVLRSSVLPPEIHQRVLEIAETHSGLSIYRDGLRVMPYGRPESDFFRIEERRQSQAGREFWASRRLFGRISISRELNPNLRDKAGREGLIDNGASRALQVLVVDLLKSTARRYFGGDAPIRKELLPAIEAENSVAAAAAKTTQARQFSLFRAAIKEQLPRLDTALDRAREIGVQLEASIAAKDADSIWQLGKSVNELVTEKASLRVPPKPKKLGRFEESYRSYRDRYSAMAANVEGIRESWSRAVSELSARPVAEVARSQFSRNQKAVTDQLSRWRRATEAVLKSEMKRLEQSVEEDGKEYYKQASPLVKSVESKQLPLRAALEEMDALRESLLSQFTARYEPYLRALSQLSEGLDLDSAVAYSAAHGETLERRLEQVQGLAQIGVSVEILSHELHALDRRLAAGLEALPAAVHDSVAYQQTDTARRELVERLRFLSQMQIAGGDARQRITGGSIKEYVQEFFGSVLEEHKIVLQASSEFFAAAFFEFPSRIYPVFINLVNNSIYWLSAIDGSREIRFDARDGTLVVADNGPGIDPDDFGSLFELFFSRRVRGRGVGLYLCRQTLAAGGHVIEYVTEERSKVLRGANFFIKLRGGFDG